MKDCCYRFDHQDGRYDHSWSSKFSRFRLCIETGVVPSSSLCDALQELIDNRAGIKLCLSNDGCALRKKNVKVVDFNSLLCSVRLGQSRVALLHVVTLCFHSNFGNQFDPGVKDYDCRNFTDFFFVYWSPLSKVKKLSRLPFIDYWFEYIDELFWS